MFNELGKQAYSALRHKPATQSAHHVGMGGNRDRVLLLAYGTGFERGLMIAFETFGGNFIAIFPGRTSLQAGWHQSRCRSQAERAGSDYLRAEVPFIKRLSPEVNKQSLVAYGTRSASYDVRGTYASYQKIRHVDVAEGSFFGEQEISLTAACRPRV